MDCFRGVQLGSVERFDDNICNAVVCAQQNSPEHFFGEKKVSVERKETTMLATKKTLKRFNLDGNKPAPLNVANALTELEKTVKELKKNNKSLKLKLDDTETTLKVITEEKKDLEKELVRQQKVVDDLKTSTAATFKTLKDGNQALITENLALGAENVELSKRNQNILSEQKSLEKQLDALKSTQKQEIDLLNKNLGSKNVELTGQIENLQKSISILGKEKEKTESAHKVCVNSLQLKFSEFDSLKTLNNKTTESFRNLKEKFDQLQLEKIGENSRSEETQRKENAKFTETLRNKESELTTINLKLNLVNAQMVTFNEEKGNWITEKSGLELRIGNLGNELRSKQEDINKLELNVKELTGKVTELTNNLEKAKQDIKLEYEQREAEILRVAIEKTQQEVKKLVDPIISEYDDKQRTLDDYVIEKDTEYSEQERVLEQKSKTLDEGLDVIHRQQKDLVIEKESIDKQLKEIGDYETKRVALVKQIDELGQTEKRLSEKIHDLEVVKESLSKTQGNIYSDQTNEINSMKAELAETRKSLVNMQKTIGDTVRENISLQEKMGVLSGEVDALKYELNSTAALKLSCKTNELAVQKLTSEVNTLKETIKELEAKTVTLQSTINDQKNSIEKGQKVRDELKNLNAPLELKIDEQAEQLEKYESEKLEMEKAKEKLADERLSLINDKMKLQLKFSDFEKEQKLFQEQKKSLKSPKESSSLKLEKSSLELKNTLENLTALTKNVVGANEPFVDKFWLKYFGSIFYQTQEEMETLLAMENQKSRFEKLQNNYSRTGDQNREYEVLKSIVEARLNFGLSNTPANRDFLRVLVSRNLLSFIELDEADKMLVATDDKQKLVSIIEYLYTIVKRYRIKYADDDEEEEEVAKEEEIKNDEFQRIRRFLDQQIQMVARPTSASKNTILCCVDGRFEVVAKKKFDVWLKNNSRKGTGRLNFGLNPEFPLSQQFVLDNYFGGKLDYIEMQYV